MFLFYHTIYLFSFQEEIETASLSVEDIQFSKEYPLHPLIKYVRLEVYSNLPKERQNLCFSKSNKQERRIILATNIAETSLTIPGVKHVY